MAKVTILSKIPSEDGLSSEHTPLFGERIAAGFPSPADDYLEGPLDLNKYLIRHPAATFFVRVTGDSMIGAGIHSGDSACVIPSFSLSDDILKNIKDYTYKIAKSLKVRGLINIQYAIKDSVVYVLEANPRASRTVPFVSKTIKIPLAKVAARVMTGFKLKDLNFERIDSQSIDYFSVKEAVLPFNRFPGFDTILGPEMKSTGEVMGIDKSFGIAFAKSQIATNQVLPVTGTVFISVSDKDKNTIIPLSRSLQKIGFKIIATKGTADILEKNGILCDSVLKISEGRPNVLDMMKNGEIDLIINTPEGSNARSDGYYLRTAAVMQNIPSITTISAAKAVVQGINALQNNSEVNVKCIQDY